MIKVRALLFCLWVHTFFRYLIFAFNVCIFSQFRTLHSYQHFCYYFWTQRFRLLAFLCGLVVLVLFFVRISDLVVFLHIRVHDSDSVRKEGSDLYFLKDYFLSSFQLNVLLPFFKWFIIAFYFFCRCLYFSKYEDWECSWILLSTPVKIYCLSRCLYSWL